MSTNRPHDETIIITGGDALDSMAISHWDDDPSQLIVNSEGGAVFVDRSDAMELVQFITEWLEEAPVPDGWYVMKWREGGRHVFAARVYNGVQYNAYGGELNPRDITYIRRLGDLTPEDISTLKKEDA